MLLNRLSTFHGRTAVRILTVLPFTYKAATNTSLSQRFFISVLTFFTNTFETMSKYVEVWRRGVKEL